MKRKSNYRKERTKSMMDAFWQYCLDHADVSKEGVLFVKFHTKSKQQLYSRIRARMKGVARSILTDKTVEKRRETMLATHTAKRLLKEVQKLNEDRAKNRSWFEKIKRRLFK